MQQQTQRKIGCEYIKGRKGSAGAPHLRAMRVKSRARQALCEGIRHVARTGVFEEFDVTCVDTFAQEMILDMEVTRAITVHGGSHIEM